jgi:threonine/homoserine/homoserine lactone efflux protein
VPRRILGGVLTQLAAFLGVAAVVICTPGQDTALTIRNVLAGGRGCGVATAAGVALGQAVWTVAAAVGVVAVLQASQPAFMAVRYAGAAYLVYLGLQSLRAALARRRRDVAAPPPALLTPAAALRQGVVSNLANPKMVAFFTSLLPQFAPDGGGALATLFGFGFLFCLLTFVWLAAYSFAVARARRLLSREAVRRALDALLGTVLVALGLRLALDRR